MSSWMYFYQASVERRYDWLTHSVEKREAIANLIGWASR